MKDLTVKAKVLIEALPYFQEFRDEIIVIKFGGSVMEDPAKIKAIMRDIVFMECVGMKPVVVHGGGKAITAKLNELNIETKFVHGLRYTCEDTLSVVDDVLHNDVNQRLIKGAAEAAGEGIQLSGKRFIEAKKLNAECPKTGSKEDIGFVGEVVDVDISLITEQLENAVVPIIPPLGYDKKGQIYNINADIAACKIAEALLARKLVFVSDVPGILQDKDDEYSLISSIKVSDVDGLINEGTIVGGMIPKIKSAISALNAGTNKVHMIDGRLEHSLLLEIFTDAGVGTEITR